MRDSFQDTLSKQSSSEDMDQKKSYSESSKKLSDKALDKQVGGDHYKSMPIQVVEFCQKNQLNACESNIVKYACRHKNKGGVIDVDKIIHYAQLLKQIDYPDEASNERTDR